MRKQQYSSDRRPVINFKKHLRKHGKIKFSNKRAKIIKIDNSEPEFKLVFELLKWN